MHDIKEKQNTGVEKHAYVQGEWREHQEG